MVGLGPVATAHTSGEVTAGKGSLHSRQPAQLWRAFPRAQMSAAPSLWAG
jgi:hypothetical protein